MHSAPTRRFLATIAAAAVAIAVLAPATSAAAIERINVAFDKPAITIEYGEEWSLLARIGVRTCDSGCKDAMTFTMESIGESVVADTNIKSAYLSSYDLEEPLPVGTHEVAASFKDWIFVGQSRENAVITVTPAKIAVDLRVDGDPQSREGAIVSAQLQGSYIDRSECYECWPTVIPSGTWTFTIVDETGKEARSESFATKDKESRFASFYWIGVPAGSSFTASATFTPEKPLASNLAVTNDDNVQFTSPDAPPKTDADADVAPVVEREPAPVAEAPLWTLLVAGGALVTLLVATVILINLKPRKKTTPTDPIGATA